jgi:hypothetical protein
LRASLASLPAQVDGPIVVKLTAYYMNRAHSNLVEGWVHQDCAMGQIIDELV